MSSYCDLQYKHLIKNILDIGESIETRNSKVKRLLFGEMHFKYTPLVTIRKTAWKSALREWEWFMSGSCRLQDLHESVQHWWLPWARLVEGEEDQGLQVPNNYSKQFRGFYGRDWIDQIEYLIEGIKRHPYSRRNVITTWNTADMASPDTPITNCHGSLISFHVDKKNNLHLWMCQRSVDVIVGLPHNLIQYWAFLVWMCSQTNRQIGSFTWYGLDCHIYEAHFDLARRMLNTPRQETALPNLLYKPTKPKDFRADDFYLDYEYCPVLNETAVMVV